MTDALPAPPLRFRRNAPCQSKCGQVELWAWHASKNRRGMGTELKAWLLHRDRGRDSQDKPQPGTMAGLRRKWSWHSRQRVTQADAPTRKSSRSPG